MPDFNEFYWRKFLYDNLYENTGQNRKSSNKKKDDTCHYCGSIGVKPDVFRTEDGDFVCRNCRDW